MHDHLQVCVGSVSGVPEVEVPMADMWDLVEYLSWQRVLASYHFAATHFTVTFPHLQLTAAQRIMDEWATGQDHQEPVLPHIETFHPRHSTPLSLH